MGKLTYCNRISGKGNRNLPLEQLSDEQRKQFGNGIKREAVAAVGIRGREERKEI